MGTFPVVASGVVFGLALAACGGGEATLGRTSPGGSGGAGGEPGEAGHAGAAGSNQGGGAAGLAGGAGLSGAPVACSPTLCVVPPPADPVALVSDGPANHQAVTTLYLGDRTRDGELSSTAWQGFGLAISGKIYGDAAAGAATHCKPVDGAEPGRVIVNAPDGVDNSFGRNVLPWLTGLDPQVVPSTEAALDSARFGLIVHTDAFGAGSDYSGITGIVAPTRGVAEPGGGYAAPSDWATYPWHPLAGEQAPFTGAYLTGNRLVMASVGELPMRLMFFGHELRLVIHRATVVLDYASDHSSGPSGIVSGILDPVELAAAAEGLTPGACSSANENSIDELHQAADIGLDGEQHPEATCDGISIGLGIVTVASAVSEPKPDQPPVNLCEGMLRPGDSIPAPAILTARRLLPLPHVISPRPRGKPSPCPQWKPWFSAPTVAPKSSPARPSSSRLPARARSRSPFAPWP